MARSTRSPGRSSLRLAAAVVAMAAGLAVAGCGDVGPPFACPWSGTPDVAREDLVGGYVGGAEPGQVLHLADDGTYTTSGFAHGDWYSGYELRVEAGEGRWEEVYEEHLGVPFIDVPHVSDTLDLDAVRLVEPDGLGSTDLDIGGTREAPVLFQSDPLERDTCDVYSSLFRKG